MAANPAEEQHQKPAGRDRRPHAVVERDEAGDRHVRRERRDLATDRRRRLLEADRRSHHQKRRVRELPLADIRLRIRRLVQPVVPHVANDADDRPVRALVAADAHAPADRILARKNLRSGRFANDDDRLLARGVRIGQQPSPPQRHAHDLEVVDRDRVELHRRRIRAVLHAALDVKPAPIVVATQRDLGGKRGAFDARHGVQPPQHIVVKREHGLVLRPARPDERDAGGDDPVRVESGIGREQPIDGAVHQSRARDEQAAQSPPAPS